MKKQFALLLPLLAVFSLVPTPAHADSQSESGLFVEPGVTYEMGKHQTNYSQKYSVLKDSTASADGFGLVVRLGFHINEIFFVAADGRYGKLNFNDSSNNQSSTAEVYSLSPVLGVQMPNVGLRFWLGYVAASELNPGSAGGYDYKFKQGTGFLVGAGFRIKAVSLNVEYKDVNYASTDFEQTPIGVTSSNSDLTSEDKAWIASVTFPLQL